MPDLLSRVARPSTLRRLVQCPSRLCYPVRCYHEASTRSHPSVADSLLQSQTSLNEDGVLSKARKHGFRDLQVSPLLGTHEKKQQQKKQPILGMSSTEDLVEFQKEFEDNVHAHALATPIRQCRLTLTHLPSHFLVPFSTVIERLPPTNDGRRPRIRATLKPGRPSEMTGECLPGTNYVLNRKDVVRHLSRKSTWVSLISERPRIAVAKLAGRKFNGRFMVQELYDWEDKVEAVEAYLERRVKVALLKAFKVKAGEEESPADCSQQPAFALRYVAPADGVTEAGPELDSTVMVYDLPSLLSPETLEALGGGFVHVAKSPAAMDAQLALEKLKAYKELDSPIRNKKGPSGSIAPSERYIME